MVEVNAELRKLVSLCCEGLDRNQQFFFHPLLANSYQNLSYFCQFIEHSQSQVQGLLKFLQFPRGRRRSKQAIVRFDEFVTEIVIESQQQRQFLILRGHFLGLEAVLNRCLNILPHEMVLWSLTIKFLYSGIQFDGLTDGLQGLLKGSFLLEGECFDEEILRDGFLAGSDGLLNGGEAGLALEHQD